MHDKKKIKSGFVWSAIDSLGNQFIALSISLVLANILGPHAFGLVAMLSVFIAVANVFVNSGFNQALIRKIDRTENDFSTAFYFGLIVSLVCYAILFVSSPLIAEFYDKPELTELTRVLALIIVINSFGVIQRVKLSVKLDFKTQAKCNLGALFISGTTALVMAYFGLGVWALVGQQLILALVGVLLLNLCVPWRPKEKFNKKSFDELFGFGSKLLLSGLIDTIYKNIYSLIIGKQFSSTQLGLYNQAERLSKLPAMTLTSVVQKVTYPMLSNMQNDTSKLDRSYLLTLQLAAFVIFPVMFGISIVAQPLVSILLGEEWVGSAVYISIISLAFMLYPIHAINLNMLQVKGRSDLFLKLEIIKKINFTIMILITAPISIKAMCIGMVVTSYIALGINTYYSGKLSSLTALKQFRAIFPMGAITAIAGTVGFFIGASFINDYIKLAMTLVMASFIYFGLMFVFQREFMINLKSIIKN